MRKVQIGQPLRLPASAFNTMLDAAQDYRNRSMTTRGHGLPVGSQSGIVTVRNESGADQDQFAVMGISGLVVNPADNAREFFYRYALTVVTPTADHDGKFVILQEPIRNDGFGKAMIAGVTPVNILGDSSNQSKTAGISAGQTYLEPDGDGAQILWEAETSGSAQHLALVRFPFTTAAVNTFSRAAISKGGKGILLPDSLGRLVAAQLLATRDVAVVMSANGSTAVTMRAAGPQVYYKAPTGYWSHSWNGDASYPSSNIQAGVTRSNSQYWFISRIFSVINLGTVSALRGYSGPVWYRFKYGSLQYYNGLSPNTPISTNLELYLISGAYSPQYDILPGAALVGLLPLSASGSGLFLDQLYIYLGDWPGMGQYVTLQGKLSNDQAWIDTNEIIDTVAFYQYVGSDGAGIVLQDMNNSLAVNVNGATAVDMPLTAARALALSGNGSTVSLMQLGKG